MIDSYIPTALPLIPKGSQVIVLKTEITTPLTGKRVLVGEGGLSVLQSSEFGPLYRGTIISDNVEISLNGCPVSLATVPGQPEKCLYCDTPHANVSPWCESHLSEWTKLWNICKEEQCWNRIDLNEIYCEKHGGHSDWKPKQKDAPTDSSDVTKNDKKEDEVIDKQAEATKDIEQDAGEEEIEETVSVSQSQSIGQNGATMAAEQESEFCNCGEDHEEEEEVVEATTVGQSKAKIPELKKANIPPSNQSVNSREEETVRAVKQVAAQVAEAVKSQAKSHEEKKEATMFDKVMEIGANELQHAANGNVRALAKQFKTLFKESLIAGLSDDEEDTKLRNRISRFLDGTAGDFLMSNAASKLIALIPDGIPGADLAHQIGNELADAAYGDAEFAALELIMKPMRQVITGALKGNKTKAKPDFTLIPEETNALPVESVSQEKFPKDIESAQYETVGSGNSATKATNR